MNNTTRINKTNPEDVKLRKLIVEAPELKEGQTDSSGGIRKNGKIYVQYKNPIPYEESKLAPATPQRTYTRKDMLKDQAKDFAINVGTDLISMFWYECGRPFVQAKLHQLGQKAITNLESPTKASNTIDVEYIEIPETDDLDNNNEIIRFPNRRIS